MVNYSKIIADTASNHYNVRDEYKDNTVEQNKAIQKSQTRKFSVGAINITGELNIGMMIRSACLMGAENFYIFGRKKFDKRSTVGAENYINIKQFTYDDPLTADKKICDKVWETRNVYSHKIILCEQDGWNIGKYPWKGLYDGTSVADFNPLFLFGSESHGFPQSILDSGFTRVSIPQVGVLRSFNVSAAMNIIIWAYIKEVFL
jgi:tRNA G18 (ribose-2'-O)-methylase SpoU